MLQVPTSSTATKSAMVQSPYRLLQRQCACGTHTGGGECESCKAKKGQLQRAALNSNQVDEVPAVVHDVLNSPGRPLDSNTRGFMESRFGQDFSAVRVHTDSRAADSAQSVNALAYTVGSNIVFGTGQYLPGSRGGQRLLAHELAHVVQQKGATFNAIQTQLRVGSSHDASEREADQIADRVLSADVSAVAAPVQANSQPVLRRTPQRVGEERLVNLPPQTRGDEQVQIHVFRTLVNCPCRNVPDSRQGIFYNPDLNNLAIAYRHCRGGTTTDVYAQLQSNATDLLQGQSTNPQATGRVVLDVNLVARNVGGRIILEAVGSSDTGGQVGGGAQLVLQGGQWRVFLTADFRHRLTELDPRAANQLDIRLGGQFGIISAEVQVSNLLSGQPQIQGSGGVAVPGTGGNVRIGPFVQGGGDQPTQGGIGVFGRFGGPEVRREERCFQCYCPPAARRYRVVEDVLPRDEPTSETVPVERQEEYRYYFRYDRTDPSEEADLRTQSNTNLDTAASLLRGGARAVMISGYASPEGTERTHNEQLSNSRAEAMRRLLQQRVGAGVTLPQPSGGGELLGRRPEPNNPSGQFSDAIRENGFRSAEELSFILLGEEIPNAELAQQFIGLFNRLTEPADRLALFGLNSNDPIAPHVLAAVNQFMATQGRGPRPWERIFRLLRYGVIMLRRDDTEVVTGNIHHSGSLQELPADSPQSQAYIRQAEAVSGDSGFGPIDPSALRPSRSQEESNRDCEEEPSADDRRNGCDYTPRGSSGLGLTAPEVAPRRLQ